MIDFNLEYYRAFYYVAQLGSVSKAANALFLSQPAITRSVKQLEEHLGCKLFTRIPRGMQMTSEGKVLFDYVEKAFGQFIAAEKTLRRMASFEAGILNIGATETALYHFLLPIIERFRAAHPGIFINISGSSSPEIVQGVRNGMVDLALAVSPLEDVGDLIVMASTTFRDIFVAGRELMESEKLAGRTLTAKEICSLPLVSVEKGTSARSNIDLWFKEQGMFFEPDYSVRTSSTVLPFVLRNLAIGIVPELFARELLAEQEVFEIPIDKPIPERQIMIVHKDPSQMTALCRRFVDFLRGETIGSA